MGCEFLGGLVPSCFWPGDTGRDCIKCSSPTKYITIERCTIYASGQRANDNAEGIDAVNCENLVVRGCHIYDTATSGLYAKGGSLSPIIEGNLIRNTGSNGIALGLTTDGDLFPPGMRYETRNGIVTNNIVLNTGMSQETVVEGKGGHGILIKSSLNARVYNNTVINAGHGQDAADAAPLTLQREQFDIPNKGLTTVNNLFFQGSGHGSAENSEKTQMVRPQDEPEGSILIDHNLYYHEDGNETFGGNSAELGGASRFGDWQAQGFGASSVLGVNPQFVSLVNPHLREGSPATRRARMLTPPNPSPDARPKSGSANQPACVGCQVD